MEFLKEFGNLVRTNRKVLDYSQEKIAEKADISSRHVPNIESGKCDVRLSLAVRLADCLDIDLNGLKKYIKCDENGNYGKDLLK